MKNIAMEAIAGDVMYALLFGVGELKVNSREFHKSVIKFPKVFLT